MVKRCCHGTCNSDTRFLSPNSGVKFFPVPKPKTQLEACKQWIKACGRPHEHLNINKINKHSYVCSKHFVDGEPSVQHPCPMPADGSAAQKGRRVLNQKLQDDPTDEITGDNIGDTEIHEDQHIQAPSGSVAPSKIQRMEQPSPETADIAMLAADCTIQTLQDKIRILETQLASVILENDDLKSQLKHLQESNASKSSTAEEGSFSVDRVVKAPIKKLFEYYTGYSHLIFMMLFNFLVPNGQGNPITYKERKKACAKIKLQDQLFLVLCRLRNGLHVMDLAYRFNTKPPVVSALFNSWITYMYLRLGSLTYWPHRDTILHKMTSKYKSDFPSSLAIIDCTELRTETPSSLLSQSQCYSDYKSSTTLKALVVVDPRGSFMFTTTLFSGSISDNEICQQGGFYQLLKDLMEDGYILPGDAIMADKGFRIESELSKLGLKLNIPPFASSAYQMSAADVSITRKIAAHRIHVERSIRQIKNYKLLSRTIPVSLFGNINKMWTVCCILTTFQDVFVKDD